MKTILTAIAALALLVGGFYALNAYIYKEKQAVATPDYKDAEYVIGGERIKLSDGVAETDSAPGSASKTVTRYFGNELKIDLDGDTDEDVVFLLTQETGGSGTFYYVVAAVDTENGYVGSDAYLLGDRIAPQTTEVSPNPSHKNVIVVNYADRAAGEPMTAQPSIGKSAYLKLDPSSLQWGIVEASFEGEADPSRMTLGMKSWVWISALYNDGREVRPNAAGDFSLTLADDGTFTTTTDCNNMAGRYEADAITISFSDIVSTKKFCEGSQETEFARLLENAQGYHFTSRGELIIDLQFDSGTATFR